MRFLVELIEIQNAVKLGYKSIFYSLMLCPLVNLLCLVRSRVDVKFMIFRILAKNFQLGHKIFISRHLVTIRRPSLTAAESKNFEKSSMDSKSSHLTDF